MKLYIAGPMTGLPELNYPAFFSAEEQLRAAGFETLNPARTEGRTDCKNWLDFMRASLLDLAVADGIALLPDWLTSKGARLEAEIGYGLKLPVKPLSEWLWNEKP